MLLMAVATFFNQEQIHPGVYIAGGVSIGLLLRPLVHWYYGINELKDAINELRELLNRQSQN